MQKVLLHIGLVLAFLTAPVSMAQVAPVMEFYHGAECPHCHNQRAWLPTLLQMYPNLDVQEFEVWHNADNRQRATDRLASLGLEFGSVPTNIIKDEVVTGFQSERILELMEKHYGAPAVSLEEAGGVTEGNEKTKKILFILALAILGSGAFYVFTKSES